MSAYRSFANAVADLLVALGGNIGDVRTTLDRAIARFCDGTAVRLVARSSDYRTPPWGVEDQPPFVNCAIAAATALSPLELLQRAQTVERASGRDRARERRWGPRTLDIDLIAYDDAALATDELTLPHPRALERAFVLIPLAEIAPDRRIGSITVPAMPWRSRRSGRRRGSCRRANGSALLHHLADLFDHRGRQLRNVSRTISSISSPEAGSSITCLAPLDPPRR